MTVVSDSVPSLDRLRRAAYEWYASGRESYADYMRTRDNLIRALEESPDAYYRLPKMLVTLNGGILAITWIQADGLPTHPDKPIVDLREIPCGD